METKFNFNSAICTSKAQSERLLALGLKRETADMMLTKGIEADFIILAFPPQAEEDIPAWSLHRLIEMTRKNTIDNNAVVLSRNQTYDQLIGGIARQIKEGYFNKEYLEDTHK